MSRTEKAKYQFFRPLSAQEVACLELSILKDGPQTPVVLDEEGNVLAGHHLKRICENHGVAYETKVVANLATEDEKLKFAITMDMARRHLTPLEWAKGISKLLELEGIQLGQGRRNDLTSATIAQVATKLHVPERTMRYRLALVKTYEELDPETKAQVDAGKTTVTAVRHKRKKTGSGNRARKNTDPEEWPAESGRSSRESEAQQQCPPASSAEIEHEAIADISNERLDDHIIAFPSLSHARTGDVAMPSVNAVSTATPKTPRMVADERAAAPNQPDAPLPEQVGSPTKDSNPYTRLLRCIVDHVRANGVVEVSDLRAMFVPLQRLLKHLCDAGTTTVDESLALVEAEIDRVTGNER